uniref:Uncharacterized protein n=1 Tax=viral metagenome TaxID=1070528 RepID=A0A6M3JGW5_9ZZZZ
MGIIIQDRLQNIEARIDYKPSGKKDWDYQTSLSKWLKGKLDFCKIDEATFTDKMVIATVAFDKDHTIYILVPEDIFK